MYMNVTSLEWYDFMIEVGAHLNEGTFNEAEYESLKLVTDEATFDAACLDLANSITTAKIDALCAACSVPTTGPKKAKIAKLLMWKAGL
jgi:hypothetical protein